MGVEEIALSIKQFGAKGDGSDATAALQAAMLAAKGCSVLIPIGTFLIYWSLAKIRYCQLESRI